MQVMRRQPIRFYACQTHMLKYFLEVFFHLDHRAVKLERTQSALGEVFSNTKHGLHI